MCVPPALLEGGPLLTLGCDFAVCLGWLKNGALFSGGGLYWVLEHFSLLAYKP